MGAPVPEYLGRHLGHLEESPMFQEIGKVSAVVAAGMVGVASIGNAVGRIFWPGSPTRLPDDGPSSRCSAAGRPLLDISRNILSGYSYRLGVHHPHVLRGRVRTMPAFTADYFGSKNVGPIYGLMLTAWGFASAFGPLLIAHLRQSSGSYTSGLHLIAGIVAVSMLLPILVSPPKSATTRIAGSSSSLPAMHSR